MLDVSGTANPLVSCIIPVYNGERFLREALDSVFTQTWRPIDVIVVDDGSTDATPEVLAQYPHPIRILQQANAGPARARNQGLTAAKGDFIAFQDADDLWVPHKLTCQMERFLARPELELCVGHLQNFWEPELREAEERLKNHELARPRPAWGPPLMLARRSLFDRVGYFNESLRIGEDTDWQFRAREKGVIWEMLADVLVLRRRHGRNLTANWAAGHGGLAAMLKRSLDRRRDPGKA